MAHGWLTSISVYSLHRNTYVSKTDQLEYFLLTFWNTFPMFLNLVPYGDPTEHHILSLQEEPVRPATFPDDVEAHVNAHQSTREVQWTSLRLPVNSFKPI